ncbi:acetyl-CoA carboxylase biotin carboxyl carrier protein subunit [bacterium]|nr:acetyl-CoA carboxylase biotin carboxyl carrier protein subunit [bacterium]
MRFKVHQKGDKETWYFEVGDHILANGIRSGQIFKARKLNAELSHLEDVDVRLHPDGRSICINEVIVPFSGTGLLLKGPDARLKMGAPATFRRLTIDQVKPIAAKKSTSSLGGGEQKSPLTGKVISVLVREGQPVNEGDVLFTIEAMKMENRILAECRGTILNVKVTAGVSVSVGDLLCSLQPVANENGT